MTAHIFALLSLEKYVPYMSEEEIKEYARALRVRVEPDFSVSQLVSWERRKEVREAEIKARFADVFSNSLHLCKTQTLKK